MAETSAKTARFVRKLDDMQGDAAVYELTPPYAGTSYDHDDRSEFAHRFVAVSAIDLPSMPALVTAGYRISETYIFPSDGAAVTDWGELVGIHHKSHADALTELGYAIATGYPVEVLDDDSDDGTMPGNVADLTAAVVGHRIVSAERGDVPGGWRGTTSGFIITLDNGKRVALADTDDCCAFTALEDFLLNADKIEHVITGVGTTDGYTKWHVYADLGDVLELSVGWSSGNPFYYGYGFDIAVSDVEPAAVPAEGGNL